MRTSEEFVVAEIESNGRTYERKFYIATKNGELMTRRLRRLLAGSISHYYDQRNRERVYFHFVGMICGRRIVCSKRLSRTDCPSRLSSPAWW